MEETILTWNVTNWITVVLMAALGFLALALVAQFFHAARGKASTTTQYGATPDAVASA